MEDNVGTIVIGTKVDSSGLEKGYKNVEKKAKEMENKKVKITYDSDTVDWADERWHEGKAGSEKEYSKWVAQQNTLAEKQVQIQQQVTSELQNQIGVQQQINEVKNQDLVEYDFLGGYNAQIEQLQKKLWDLQATYNMLANEPGFNAQSQDARELEIEIEKLINQIDRMREKQSKLNNEGFAKMEKGFSGLVKKAGKLALALVGVRTIINLITRSFNTLTQYNEELGTKVEQMRLVLAVALEPIINWIINALQVVLSLFDKIYSALFGISLYGRANELWSQKMAKNMASGAGSAKEMRKQLAGFDEMNVLNDNVAGSGGGGGFDMQDFILPDTPIPKGLQWIMDNGEPLGAIMGGVAGGALLMADGLFRLNIALQEYDKNPTLENFGEVVHRAGEAWAGFGMLAMSPVTTIGGAITAISGILTNHKEEVDKWVDDVTTNVYDQADWLSDNVSTTMGAMWENVGKDIEGGKEDFYDFMTEAQSDFDSLGRTIELFKEGDIKGAWNEIVNWLSTKWEFEKTRFKKNLDRITANISRVVEGLKTDLGNLWKWIEDNLLNPIVDGWNKSWDAIKTIVSMAINHVVGEFWRIVGIIDNVGLTIAEFIGGAVRGVVNGALTFAENRINDFIRMINNVVGIINKIPGVNIGRIGYVSLPRMAVGGIINQPGRGVPVGGAIAGESGREGILPLTDKQTMAELGKEIGKWISIQATVPVNIGNRQVARVIQELNNDREFAMNS